MDISVSCESREVVRPNMNNLCTVGMSNEAANLSEQGGVFHYSNVNIDSTSVNRNANSVETNEMETEVVEFKIDIEEMEFGDDCLSVNDSQSNTELQSGNESISVSSETMNLVTVESDKTIPFISKISLARFQCPFCSKCYWNAKNCDEHLKLFHSDKCITITQQYGTLFYCGHCIMLLDNILDVKNHCENPIAHTAHCTQVKDEHLVKKNICNALLCKFPKFEVTPDNISLKEKNAVIEILPLGKKCKNCALYLPDIQAYDLHVNRIHNKKLSFSYIVNVTVDEEGAKYVKNHIIESNTILNTSHLVGLFSFDHCEFKCYVCPYCSEEFGFKDKCIQHLKHVHSQCVLLNYKYVEQSKHLFKCKLCGNTYETVAQSCDHSSTCKSGIQRFSNSLDTCIFICTFCKLDFKSSHEICIHQQNVHAIENVKTQSIILTLYICNKCFMIFNLHFLFLTHSCKYSMSNVVLNSVSQDGTISSFLKNSTIHTPVNFKDYRTLSTISMIQASQEEHTITNNQKLSLNFLSCVMKLYSCPQCEQSFKLNEELVKHGNTVHFTHFLDIKETTKQVFICRHCFIMLTSVNKCVEHNTICHIVEYYCSNCKQIFLSNDKYCKHVYDHCKNVCAIENQVTYGCFKCTESFHSLGVLEHHMQQCIYSHSACEEQFNATLCETAPLLDDNTKINHPNVEDSDCNLLYECKTCGQFFTGPSQLKELTCFACNNKNKTTQSENTKNSNVSSSKEERENTCCTVSEGQTSQKILPKDVAILDKCSALKNVPREESVAKNIGLVKGDKTQYGFKMHKVECSWCFMHFNNRVEFCDHVNADHFEMKQVVVGRLIQVNKCEWCQVYFSDSADLKVHNCCNRKICHENVNNPHLPYSEEEKIYYRCNICTKGFYLFMHCRNHVVKEHKAERGCKNNAIVFGILKLFKCNLCNIGFGFVKKTSLIDHMEKEHDYKLSCDPCVSSATSECINTSSEIEVVTLTSQDSQSDESKQRVCKNCDAQFVSDNLLSAHKTVQCAFSVVKKKVYYCEMCKKKFSSQSRCIRHIAKKCSKNSKVMKGDRDVLKCNICNIYFATENVFKKHLIKDHGLKLNKEGKTACEVTKSKVKTTRITLDKSSDKCNKQKVETAPVIPQNKEVIPTNNSKEESIDDMFKYLLEEDSSDDKMCESNDVTTESCVTDRHLQDIHNSQNCSKENKTNDTQSHEMEMAADIEVEHCVDSPVVTVTRITSQQSQSVVTNPNKNLTEVLAFEPHVPATVANKEIMYECHLCTKYFADESTLNEHFSCIHLKQTKVTEICDICSVTFYSPLAFTAHKNSIIKNVYTTKKIKILKCELCNVPVRNHEAIHLHLKNVHNCKNITDAFFRQITTDLFKCKICNERKSYKTNNLKALASHMRESHEYTLSISKSVACKPTVVVEQVIDRTIPKQSVPTTLLTTVSTAKSTACNPSVATSQVTERPIKKRTLQKSSLISNEDNNLSTSVQRATTEIDENGSHVKRGRVNDTKNCSVTSVSRESAAPVLNLDVKNTQSHDSDDDLQLIYIKTKNSGVITIDLEDDDS